MAKRPLICLPTINWEYLFQRPQQLMLRFSRLGHPVYYINPKVVVKENVQVEPNLWVINHDLNQLPAEVIENAIYFSYYPMQATAILPGRKKFIVYDCADDEPNFAGQEDLILSRADLVLCTTDLIMKKIGRRHRRLLLLPNGVTPQLFLDSDRTLPPEIMTIKSQTEAVIGFTGAFCPDWVDVDLVFSIARDRPNWSIVVVGQSYLTRACDLPANLIYLGRKPYLEFVSYLHGFDLGLIPFLNNRMALGADPIKLYEYLAAGLPVVGRKLPCVAGLEPPLVYSYERREECLVALDQSLQAKRDANAIKLRREFAGRNSWERRLETLLKALSELTWLETDDY